MWVNDGFLHFNFPQLWFCHVLTLPSYGFVTFATEALAKQYVNKSQNLRLKDVTLAVMFAKKRDDKKEVKKQKAKKGMVSCVH